MTEQPTPTRKRRGRSPNYPGIDLGEAIERARQLYDRELRYAAPIDTIFAHWGYKPGSGQALVTLAALKRFGLLVEEGSGNKRKARLSDKAVAILLDQREDSTERLRLIQEAALEPPIHQELWAKYGAELPSDSNLRYDLQNDKAFTEGGAKEFIAQYKRTIAFAKLVERGKLSEDDEDKDKGNEGQLTPLGVKTNPPAKPRGDEGQTFSLPLPLAPGKYAVLQAPYPITESQWKALLVALEAQKLGLVVPDETQEPRQDED